MARICPFCNKVATQGHACKEGFEQTPLYALLKEKEVEIERLQDKLTYFNLEPCAHCKESEEAVERAIASRNYEADQRVSAEKKVAIAVKGLGLISMTADFCSIGRVREYAEKTLVGIKEMK